MINGVTFAPYTGIMSYCVCKPKRGEMAHRVFGEILKERWDFERQFMIEVQERVSTFYYAG